MTQAIQTDLESRSNLLHTAGDYCDFGCDENSLESVKQKIVEKDHVKGVRAVKNWVIWDLVVNDYDASGLTDLGFRPMMIYSTNVIFDLHTPYNVGTCIRSTLLVKFTDNCLFETKNTVYILVGRGSRKNVDPKLVLSIIF